LKVASDNAEMEAGTNCPLYDANSAEKAISGYNLGVDLRCILPQRTEMPFRQIFPCQAAYHQLLSSEKNTYVMTL